MRGSYWWVVAISALFTLAWFSEAFLVLRAQQGGLPLAEIPLVLVAMNLVYAASAYPFGKLSNRMGHGKLLALGPERQTGFYHPCYLCDFYYRQIPPSHSMISVRQGLEARH